MAEIKNFKDYLVFYKHNKSFIESNYYEHYYLIKVHEHVLKGEFKLIDFFNVIDQDLSILFLSTEAGISIYTNGYNDSMIELLYERATQKKYTHFNVSGNKALLLQLFSKFNLEVTIDKDRIIYETDRTLPLQKKHHGKTVNSDRSDYDQLVKYTYDYSLEEWGEREGRGIDYVKNMVIGVINQGALVQYNTSYGISCIAQVLNLKNDMPVIGSLYTPPDKRGKGYATMLVHAVTKKLLDTGYSTCGIISDATNPITNQMFIKVGYRPVSEHIAVNCLKF